MSRHPSPGPSHSQPQNAQLFQQVSAPVPRQKSKAYATGIAAGAEDVKYQAKYKELKRKVKEIEADNDKLQFKVLQAKRSIQRMKVERAVLYERLSVVPPSPDLPDRQTLPPIHSGPGVPPQLPHNSREHVPSMDPNNHALMEYIRTHGNVRVIAGPDGRPVPVTDTPMGPGVAPLALGFPPHPSKRGSGHDTSRQLPPLPHHPSAQHFEPTRIHGHSQPQSHSHPHTSPHMHSHPSSSHEGARSHPSTSRSRTHPGHSFHSQKYSPETLPPVQHVIGSPSLSGDRRRHELHELASTHSEHSHAPRHQTPLAHSPPHTQSDPRGRVGGHPHQRMGPAYLNRNEDHYDREYERDKEREWDRGREAKEREITVGRMHSPPLGYRSRPERPDSNDRPALLRAREEQSYYEGPSQGPGYPMLSRSGTPGSGSGSGSGHGGDGPSRPDSCAHIYPERMRYALRPVSRAEDLHEGRLHDRRSSGGGGSVFSTHEQSRPALDSRKRSRNEMEIDDNDAVEASSGSSGGSGGGGVFAGGHVPDDRGPKRFHQDGTATNPNRGGEAEEL